MAKTLKEHFIDWENSAFGYGYGTGEEHTIPALRQFLALCTAKDGRTSHSYDHGEVEAVMTAPLAWMMINLLCTQDIIEYGSSPRYGWLTKEGDRLREFVLDHTVDELLTMVTTRPIPSNGDDEYCECYPNACNCGTTGYDPRRKCDNPFWRGRVD